MTPTTPSPISDQAAGELDLLKEIAQRLTIMLMSAKCYIDPSDDDVVIGYRIKTGALHQIIGMLECAGHHVSIPANLPAEDGRGYIGVEPAKVLSTAPTTGSAPIAHLDDRAIDEFARLMKQKMDVSRAKGRYGWDDPDVCSVEDLSRMLHEHVAKGDPVDVANFCMMLRHYDARIAAPASPAASVQRDTGNPQWVKTYMATEKFGKWNEEFGWHFPNDDDIHNFAMALLAASMGGEKA